MQVKTQIVNHGLDQLVEIDRAAQHFLTAHAGEYQQVVDQLSHLLRRVRDGLEIALGFVVQRLAGRLRQERGVAVDVPERRAQVV